MGHICMDPQLGMPMTNLMGRFDSPPMLVNIGWKYSANGIQRYKREHRLRELLRHFKFMPPLLDLWIRGEPSFFFPPPI